MLPINPIGPQRCDSSASGTVVCRTRYEYTPTMREGEGKRTASKMHIDCKAQSVSKQLSRWEKRATYDPAKDIAESDAPEHGERNIPRWSFRILSDMSARLAPAREARQRRPYDRAVSCCNYKEEGETDR